MGQVGQTSPFALNNEPCQSPASREFPATGAAIRWPSVLATQRIRPGEG